VTSAATGLSCPQCATQIGAGLLVCPRCHWLVHGERLKELAASAEAAEAAGDFGAAAATWQEALHFLPAGTRQADVIGARIQQLGDRMLQSPGSAKQRKTSGMKGKVGGVAGLAALFVWKFKFVLVFLLTKAKLLLLGLTKTSTLLSMLLAFGVYWSVWGWWFAAGLIVSLYIHEMGHVASLRHYGIPATAPMFIPGLGAFVRMKQYPPTPALDARVGLAGPIWGLGAALAAYGLYLASDNPMWAAIAQVGAWINLFNLLPVWTLDGGRAFHALSRAERGLAAAAIGITWYATSESLLVLLLIMALVQVFTARGEQSDRPVLYQYAGLVAVLALLTRIPVATP
jgi:Zn-dependent protease